MGEKSEQKREFILKQAKEVFARKGFRDVTMKDIVEACDISRGGLYLYFGSTEEIFREILISQMEHEDDDLTEHISEGFTMADLLLLFLKEQKKQILRKKQDISIAAYEYYFANRHTKKDENLIRNQFQTGVEVLTRILQEGTQRGEFYCEDYKTAARNIMYTVEGMKICAKTMGITESKVDQQFLYMIEGLVIEE